MFFRDCLLHLSVEVLYSSSLITALRRDNKHGRILTCHRIEAALEEAKNQVRNIDKSTICQIQLATTLATSCV